MVCCQKELRNNRPEVFLGKGALKIRSKSTGEHPCRSTISIMLQSNFIEITIWHVCSPVNLLRIFRTLFYKNTSGWLLLETTLTLNLIRTEVFQVLAFIILLFSYHLNFFGNSCKLCNCRWHFLHKNEESST